MAHPPQESLQNSLGSPKRQKKESEKLQFFLENVFDFLSVFFRKITIIKN
jgi:hypothetical protein